MADLVPLDKTQEDGPRANDALIAESGLSAEVEEQAPVQEDAGSSTGEPETNPGQGHLDQNIGDEGRENLTEDSEGQRAVEENSEIPQQQSGGEQEAEPGPESSFPPIE